MEDAELLRCNARGLIPGPLETEEEFQKRVTFCLGLKEHIHELLPSDVDQFESPQVMLEQALKISKNCWDISPDWVPLFFSNKGLQLWHGGAAWIFQTEEKGPLAAFLQLRREFYRRESCLGLYKRDELIAHEYAHVGRMAFNEPRYEELFAYRASPRGLARYFGPLIQSAFESKLFVFLLVALLLMDLFFLLQGALQLYYSLLWLKLIPLALLLLAFLRLCKRQRNLHTCETKLKEIYGTKAAAITYRLTDQEIERFAQAPLEDIRCYISDEPSLRWHLIRLFAAT